MKRELFNHIKDYLMTDIDETDMQFEGKGDYIVASCESSGLSIRIDARNIQVLKGGKVIASREITEQMDRPWADIVLQLIDTYDFSQHYFVFDGFVAYLEDVGYLS